MVRAHSVLPFSCSLVSPSLDRKFCKRILCRDQVHVGIHVAVPQEYDACTNQASQCRCNSAAPPAIPASSP